MVFLYGVFTIQWTIQLGILRSYRFAMRFVFPSLVGICVLLCTGFTLAQPGATNFMNVRQSVAKIYETEGEIPTEKYFREYEQSIVYSTSFNLGF